MDARDRPFPEADLDVPQSLVAFLDFLRLTARNKLAGLDVVQEVARHVGHLDVLRELIDGSTGE